MTLEKSAKPAGRSLLPPVERRLQNGPAERSAEKQSLLQLSRQKIAVGITFFPQQFEVLFSGFRHFFKIG